MRFAVKEVREKKGMTQDELAKAAGVARATLSKLETNGTDACNTQTLARIADALGVPVRALFVE